MKLNGGDLSEMQSVEDHFEVLSNEAVAVISADVQLSSGTSVKVTYSGDKDMFEFEVTS